MPETAREADTPSPVLDHAACGDKITFHTNGRASNFDFLEAGRLVDGPKHLLLSVDNEESPSDERPSAADNFFGFIEQHSSGELRPCESIVARELCDTERTCLLDRDISRKTLPLAGTGLRQVECRHTDREKTRHFDSELVIGNDQDVGAAVSVGFPVVNLAAGELFKVSRSFALKGTQPAGNGGLKFRVSFVIQV